MRNVQSTLLYRWFNEVWNNQDEAAIDRLMTDDGDAHGIVADSQPKGPEGFKLFFHDFNNQFDQIKIDIDDVISEDDMETARTTVSAIHRQTGKPVKFTGMCMVKVRDGKISEAWNNFDFLTLYQQLGQQLAPAN